MDSQNKRVLQYIEDFGSINPIQALSDLGVMRLASRICELRKDYDIKTTMIKAKNRYGEDVSYAEYTLER